MGHPVHYTEAVAEEICDRLKGGETLIAICKFTAAGEERVPRTFPAFGTVYDWAEPGNRLHKPDFTPMFATAKLRQQQFWLEESVHISNTPEIGEEQIYENSRKSGRSVRRARKDMIQHRTLKIDTRLKVIARMNPQLWAERLQQAVPAEQDPNKVAPRLVIEGGLPDNDPPPPAHDAQEP